MCAKLYHSIIIVNAVAAVLVGGNPAITNEISQAYSGSNQGNGSLLLAPYQGSSKPSAFLNYILFDEEYKVIEAKSAPVGPANVLHQVTLPTVQVKELGYLFVYLSYDNESAHWVHFDELKITHTESPVLQVNAYYPFGMMAYTWLRDGEKEHLYGYQGKEYDSLTRWHDFHARQYDGALGRWFAVDPQDQFASPYLAMGNNPVMMVDPDGEFAIETFLITAFKIYQYASAAYNVYKGYQEGGLIGAGRAFTMAGFMWAFGQASNMLAGQLASSLGLNNSSVGEIVGRNLFTAAFNVGTIAGLTGLMGGDVRKSITSSAPYALIAATLVTSAEIDDYKLRWGDISPTPERVFLPEVVITAKRLGNTDQPIPGTGKFDPLPYWWGHPSYLSSFNNNIRAAQGAWAPFAMTLVTAPLSLMSGGGAVLSRGANAAKGGSRVFEVGSYNTLKGVEAGLEAHHVGQRALMKKFVPGYNANTAPSILVPKQGHTLGSGVLSRGTSGFSNARQVLARDIFELRRVYPNVPNSSLQQIIQMNKTMYPGAFIK